jgi:hypothetical protein
MTSIDYKFGTTCFVELNRNNALKYSIFNEMYWLKEHSVLLNLLPYKSDNIIKYHSGKFMVKADPKTELSSYYFQLAFPLYSNLLSECDLYSDLEIIQFMLDITSALAFLHSKSITHRDLKQNNIMIHNGRYIIIDFSHSIILRNITTLEKNIVTYSHRAPEIFDYAEGKCNTYDEKIDIWSLGTILLEKIICSTLFNRISDGTEKDFGNKCRRSDFIDNIKLIYWSKCRTLLYSDVYINWILLMLEQNPEKRISAKSIYEEILSFVKSKNLSVIIPINGMEVLKPNNDKLSKKIISDNKSLEYSSVEQYLTSNDTKLINELFSIYSKKCGLKISSAIFNEVIDYIFKKYLEYRNVKFSTLKEARVKEIVLSICLILSNAIYDDVIEVENALVAINDKEITFDSLYSTMSSLILRFDKDLFLYDAFKYDMNLMSNGSPKKIRNIPIIHNTLTSNSANLSDPIIINNTPNIKDTVIKNANVSKKLQLTLSPIKHTKIDSKTVVLDSKITSLDSKITTCPNKSINSKILPQIKPIQSYTTNNIIYKPIPFKNITKTHKYAKSPIKNAVLVKHGGLKYKRNIKSAPSILKKTSNDKIKVSTLDSILPTIILPDNSTISSGYLSSSSDKSPESLDTSPESNKIISI